MCMWHHLTVQVQVQIQVQVYPVFLSAAHNLNTGSENWIFLLDTRATESRVGKQPTRYGDLYHNASRTPTSSAEVGRCNERLRLIISATQVHIPVVPTPYTTSILVYYYTKLKLYHITCSIDGGREHGAVFFFFVLHRRWCRQSCRRPSSSTWSAAGWYWALRP